MWKVSGSGDWAATAGGVASGCFLSTDMLEITHVELRSRPCECIVQERLGASCCCGGGNGSPTNDSGARAISVHLSSGFAVVPIT